MLLLAVYVGLPLLAPILMHFGIVGPAKVIYTAYSFLCHQFAFRSWFLFGQQIDYPRIAAHVPGVLPFEAFTNQLLSGAQGIPLTTPTPNLQSWTIDLLNLARGYIGDAQMGYKMALCERDMAIYGALLVGAFIYAIPSVRARLRPAPFWLYVLLGVGPIGLDGFSQLLSEPPFGLWAMRELTPAFRTLTGVLFGLMNAWLAFPYLEELMRSMAAEVRAKFAQRTARLNAEAA